MNATTFITGIPHTCESEKNVSRDAVIRAKAKAMGILNPLVSAKGVVEKEMMDEFTKDPSCNLPVRANIIRAVQRKKQSHYPKNPTDFEFDWGSDIIFSVLYCISVITFFFFLAPYERCLPEGYFRRDIPLKTRSRNDRHLIFETDTQLSLLRNAKRWYGDGTFFIRPKPFYQVFCIHAFIRHGTLTKQVKNVINMFAISY